jgi:hypothetical protein
MTELPLYQSHKRVRALKIERVVLRECVQCLTPGATIFPENTEYDPFDVDSSYVSRHNPQAGGYYVVYLDGYQSWSPAEAFEEGYTLVTRC